MARSTYRRLALGALWFAGLGTYAQVRAADDVPTPVLVHAVSRGQTLSEADFETAAVSAGTARSALAIEQAAGQEARRNLRAGNPVRASDVTAPRLVHRGETITIEVVSGALQISSAGRALDDAARGEPVRVLNLATNRTIEGVAKATGRVAIHLP